MVTYEQLVKSIEATKPRSAWDKGVKVYALKLFARPSYIGIKLSDEVPEPRILENILLNGANDWDEYSHWGKSFTYGIDIAKTLYTPSELKKVLSTDKNGYFTLRKPNAHEKWLDVQTRALYQAFKLIKKTYIALNQMSKATTLRRG